MGGTVHGDSAPTAGRAAAVEPAPTTGRPPRGEPAPPHSATSGAAGAAPSEPGQPQSASGTARLAQGREHVVARVDEIAPGEHKVVPIGRHGVGVYNVGGTFHAIANYCPHEGGPLCAGRTRGRTVVDDSVPGDAVMVRDGEFVYCPWHQWGFELATGTTAVKPEWSIRTYPVRIVGDSVVVQA